MRQTFEKEDEGKHVLTSDGDEVGTVERVAGDEAHVKPHTDLVGSIRRRLGWTDESEEMYSLSSDHVDAIEDDEIRLKSSL